MTSAHRRLGMLCAAVLLVCASALAQTHGKAPAPAKPPPAAKAPPRPSSKGKPAPSAAPAPAVQGDAGASAPPAGKAEAKTPAKDSLPADAGVTVVDHKDGGAKQFRFGETDVEGRLKAPQLVYFLRRVRAEFAAGDLGHRSFLREMSETRHDPSF